MSKRLTKQKFLEKAIAKHGNKYDYSKSEFLTSRDYILITCSLHGDFKQRVSSHLQGNVCPTCAKSWSDLHKGNHLIACRKSRCMPQDDFICKAKLIHGNKYDYSLVNYINMRTKVAILCQKHGLFLQQAGSHLRGNGCKQCGYLSDKHKTSHFWTVAQREKIESTCSHKYGAKRYLDSEIGRNKFDNIRKTSEFRNKLSKIISSDSVQLKTKQTNLARYGVSSPTKLKSVVNKIYITKKKNHTVNSSKAEILVYEMLCDFFGSDFVIHQYKDDTRYPYICDFYVKSLDLFIELNLHWSHGGHFFKTHKDDLDTLVKWQNKSDSSFYYKSSINIWTKIDLEKRDSAIRNNLNYLVFWDNNLSDFKIWLSDCQNKNIILKNI